MKFDEYLKLTVSVITGIIIGMFISGYGEKSDQFEEATHCVWVCIDNTNKTLEHVQGCAESLMIPPHSTCSQFKGSFEGMK